MRAFTPDDAKALKAAASTYPTSEFYDVDELLTSMGIGEAAVTILSEEGVPTPVVHTRLRAPASRIGPADDERVRSLREGLDAGAGASGAPADAHLRLVFGHAVEAFRALTEGSPTVLLLEDVHLADADSLALLALLVRLG